jgi:hypothetical protein
MQFTEEGLEIKPHSPLRAWQLPCSTAKTCPYLGMSFTGAIFPIGATASHVDFRAILIICGVAGTMTSMTIGKHMSCRLAGGLPCRIKKNEHNRCD